LVPVANHLKQPAVDLSMVAPKKFLESRAVAVSREEHQPNIWIGAVAAKYLGCHDAVIWYEGCYSLSLSRKIKAMLSAFTKLPASRCKARSRLS
jgi:hypothetical protein